MAGQPSGLSSEGVSAIRHPRALGGDQDGFIYKAAQSLIQKQYAGDHQLLNSFRSTDRAVLFNKRTCLTDFPQQGWMGKPVLTLYEAAGHVDWFQQTQSFRFNNNSPGFQNDIRTVYGRLDQPQQFWLSGSVLDVQLYMQGINGNLDEPRTPKVKWWTDNTPPDYGWITKNSGLLYDPTDIGFLPESNSFRMPKRNIEPDKRYGTPFKRESARTDPRYTNAARQQATDSFRMRESLWLKYRTWRQTTPADGYNIQVLPQAPFTTAKWPAIAIPGTWTTPRNTAFRATQPNDGWLTANLVAPTFNAVWMVAVSQLATSNREQYVQNLTLSPGLGKGGMQGGGALPPPTPFDATTFPWVTDAQRMALGKLWPRFALTDQKAPFAVLDVAKVYSVWAQQVSSFQSGRPGFITDPKYRQTYWDTQAWAFEQTNITFDPTRMSSNFMLASEFMRKRKWWTSANDPTELSWLIPDVLYTPFLFNSQAAQAGSFRMGMANKERRPRTYDPDFGWLFTGTPAFDPKGFPWYELSDRMLPRTYIPDRRQTTYDPDNAWNVFRPEYFDWREAADRMAAIHAKVQTQQTLSDLEVAWISANVPAIDPTTWIATLQLLNSFMAKGLYRDVRALTEMVQISWLFEPLGLPANIPPTVTPPAVDEDPHFTSSPTVTPYWLVYPRRTRHRRWH